MAPDSTHRRDFLKAAGGAALTTSLFTGNIQGANDKVNVAFIGVGRMGSGNVGYAAKVPGVEIVAVCDVYQPALARAEAQAKRLGFAGVKARKDFREILADPSIDAVCISAPDHWHAYMTVEACKAGKDVYVETPAFVYVEEGVKMVEAARQYKRVVQAGTVERSGASAQKAREMVKSGALGEIRFCRTSDYAGGATTDGGVHLLDIVQFAFDEAMPVSITAQGGKFFADDNVETPDTMLATFRYPGFIASYERRAGNTYGTAFHGTKATLMVNRGTGMNVPHWKNFLECIRTRAKPVAEIETCVRTTATCVVANLALRHGMTLDWDEKAFTVKQHDAKQYLKAKYRSPWKLEV
jgi:predicted dehydrogenase